MKVFILLINLLFLFSCSSMDVVFLNTQFENELNIFLEENKKEKEKLLYLVIADESKIFEEVIDKNDESIYLSFYYTPPLSCNGFYKSFKYRGHLIFLYNFSDKIKFSNLIDIKKESSRCSQEFLIEFIDIPPMKRYYFDEKDELIEILDDGTLRKVVMLQS